MTESSTLRPASKDRHDESIGFRLEGAQRERLRAWIWSGEDWLISRIIHYAKRQGYAVFTSTLEEAWRVSIHDLSEALGQALDRPAEITEFTPEERFEEDPVSAFAVREAAQHRRRGIALRMFLGLFKYYRASYIDWLREAGWELAEELRAIAFVDRLFDRWEIAFCAACAPMAGDARMRELQEENRRLTNEKNLFLTVIESLGSPVILLDAENRITHVNRAAAPLLDLPTRPGTFYYRVGETRLRVPQWLMGLIERAAKQQYDAEQVCQLYGDEVTFDARLRPMLDVSDKFQGTIVILHDITALHRDELVLAERAREQELLAITDPLTGVYNRRGLIELADKQVARAVRTGQSLSILFLDVDNLKRINDRHGHPAGGITLRAMAKALKECFRASDVVARIGGDEFVVLLSDRSGEATTEIEERVVRHLELAMALHDLDVEVGFSTGWSEFDKERHESFEALLREADAVMYEAKRRRRALRSR